MILVVGLICKAQVAYVLLSIAIFTLLSICIFHVLFYLKVRLQRLSTCWFYPQMAPKVGAGLVPTLGHPLQCS